MVNNKHPNPEDENKKPRTTMTQAHGIIARVSNRTPNGSYSDEHDLGEARSLVRSRKGRVGFDARHQQEGRGSVAKGEIRTNQIDR